MNARVLIRLSLIAMMFVCGTTLGVSQTLNWGDPGSVDDEVSSSEFSLDMHTDPKSYTGTYYFGMSEWSWSLEIRMLKGKLTATYTYSEYIETKQTFVQRSKSVKNFNIENGILTGDGFRGVFVTYIRDKSKRLVLVRGHAISYPEYPEVSH